MKSAPGAQNRKKARLAARETGKGAGRIWVAIVAVSLFTLLFAWALCRAAARADRQMAEAFLRHQAQALGGAEAETAEDEAGKGG